MKSLILTGKQIRLLLKVENSGYVFYERVTEFLLENEQISDGEIAEREFYEDEFDDVAKMVNGYLDPDSHIKTWDIPEQEVAELKELVNQLSSERK
jgi:hypothetical protein